MSNARGGVQLPGVVWLSVMHTLGLVWVLAASACTWRDALVPFVFTWPSSGKVCLLTLAALTATKSMSALDSPWM